MNVDDLARKALASGYEEAVEVNQRALVQKILARYSVGQTRMDIACYRSSRYIRSCGEYQLTCHYRIGRIHRLP